MKKFNFKSYEVPTQFFKPSNKSLFFISIKLKSISRLKLGTDIFNISETKEFEQYFNI